MARNGRLPPLNALRAFEAAARNLSFKKAAQELHVTPGAVSHQVRLLEEFLEMPLFRRLTRALELTPQALAMLPLVQEGLEHLAAAVEKGRARDAGGSLTVIAPPNFAARWLVPRLAGFAAAQPDIQLRLETSYRAPESLEQDVDVAIRTEENVPALRYDFLFNADIFPVCSPRLLKGGAALTPRRILDFPRLHVTSSLTEWRMLLSSVGVTDIAIEVGPKFETNELALVAAASGWGMAIGRWPFVEDDVRHGRLAIPLDLRVRSSKSWYLVYSRKARLRKIETFRNWIVAEAEKTRRAMLQQFPASA